MKIMSSLCEFEHSPLIDSSTATVVCCHCGLVLDEGLTHENIKHYGFPSYSPLKSIKAYDNEYINGEAASDLLNKIGDRLNMSQSTIDNSFARYMKTKELIQNTISCLPYTKNKRVILSNEIVLVYSIYVTLKNDCCPRSIKEICHCSGSIKPLDILKVERFLEINRKSTTPATRLKPITAKDIILTHYPYLDGFTFDDVRQLNHKINGIQCNNFSPLTTAAGSVYLYANQVKNSKPTMLQLTNLFKISSMSIQRFVKKYKHIF